MLLIFNRVNTVQNQSMSVMGVSEVGEGVWVVMVERLFWVVVVVVSWESWFEIGEFQSLWPIVIIWCSLNSEYFEYLIDF